MPKVKVSVVLERGLIEEIDALVATREYPNRSKAIEAAVADVLARRARTRLAIECARSSLMKSGHWPRRACADAGMWPSY